MGTLSSVSLKWLISWPIKSDPILRKKGKEGQVQSQSAKTNMELENTPTSLVLPLSMKTRETSEVVKR